jgi:molecular chaperone DnaK
MLDGEIMKIGIDFGTSFSLPAAVINGTPTTLLPNGEYGVPSIFYYDSEVGVQIGNAAEHNSDFEPLNAKRDIKMEISSDEDSFVADGKHFNTKQIIGYIFKEIARLAQEQSTRRELSSQNIEGAVISVPAAFTYRELNFIREAAQIPETDGGAGLKVFGIIREPVAAAIAYFNAPKGEDNKSILVYDLGGGTCDVAIVRSNRNSSEWYKVIDSDMMRIGGRDWDKVLIDMIKRRFQEKTSKVVFDSETESRIRKEAIKAKHILSNQSSARVSIIIAGKTHSCVITTEEFEKATADILNSTIKMSARMVEKCNDPIDYVVCVGGSSNMPQVKKAFQEIYPEIPIKIFEPEKAIAYGAAIYAEHLAEPQYLSDICKFSYGIKFVENYEVHKDKNRHIVKNGIFKGSPLPASYETKAYPAEDGQVSVRFTVFESDCTEITYKPEDGTEIGHVVLSNLIDSKSTDRFITTLQIDQFGLLQVKAIEEKSEKTVSAEIQLKDF